MSLKHFLTSLAKNEELSPDQKNYLLVKRLRDIRKTLPENMVFSHPSHASHAAFVGASYLGMELLMDQDSNVSGYYMLLIGHALALEYVSVLFVKALFEKALNQALTQKEPAGRFELCLNCLVHFNGQDVLPMHLYQDIILPLGDKAKHNTLLHAFAAGEGSASQMESYLKVLDDLYVKQQITTEQFSDFLNQRDNSNHMTVLHRMVTAGDADVTLMFLKWLRKNTFELPLKTLHGLLFIEENQRIRRDVTQAGADRIHAALDTMLVTLTEALSTDPVNAIINMSQADFDYFLNRHLFSDTKKSDDRKPHAVVLCPSPDCVSAAAAAEETATTLGF